MITLDQVLLLQEKVESAVKKINFLSDRISQLESDNDALNRKCLELTKALEEKTELVSTLESSQDKIEESILKTIDRLDSVEDSILGDDAGHQSGSSVIEPETNEPEVAAEANSATEEPFVYEQEETTQESSGLLHKTEQVVEEDNSNIEQESPVTDSALDGQFDIF